MNEAEYKIILFGKDYKENTYTVEVNGFTSHFYVRVPDSCTKKHCEIMKKFIIKHKSYWKKHEKALLRVTIHQKHSFRDFDNKKSIPL